MRLNRPFEGRKKLTGVLLDYGELELILRDKTGIKTFQSTQLEKFAWCPKYSEQEMSKEILMVVDSVSNEKGVPKETLFEAVELALAVATRKRYGETFDFSGY